jgi:transposase-like protein
MSERAVPFHCPYCGDEDLRPHESSHGTWHCRSCTRVFTLKLVGLAPRRGDERGTSEPTSTAEGAVRS